MIRSTWRELPPLSQSAEQSLDLAAAESQKLNHNCIGAEHILIGLLAHNSLASHILNELEFNLEEVSSRIAGGSITPQNGQGRDQAILEGRIVAGGSHDDTN